MIPYIGDFAEDASVVHYFNTFSSDDPAASITITNLADTDIYVYKDGSVTDIVTDGASVAIDFDSRTGVHKITVDTSVHADYAVGSDYMVLVEGTTIDAGTVTAALFTFSIENRYNAAADDLANGTDGLGAIKAETALILADTDELQTDDVPGLIAALDAVVDTVKAETALIVADTGTDGVVIAAGQTVATVTDVTNEVSADVTKINNNTTAAENLEASLETMLVGTATGGTTSTVTSAVTGHGDDTFIGRVLIFRTGTCQYEAGTITDYDSTAGTFTFAASTWTTNPTTETFVIV